MNSLIRVFIQFNYVYEIYVYDHSPDDSLSWWFTTKLKHSIQSTIQAKFHQANLFSMRTQTSKVYWSGSFRFKIQNLRNFKKSNVKQRAFIIRDARSHQGRTDASVHNESTLAL